MNAFCSATEILKTDLLNRRSVKGIQFILKAFCPAISVPVTVEKAFKMVSGSYMHIIITGMGWHISIFLKFDEESIGVTLIRLYPAETPETAFRLSLLNAFCSATNWMPLALRLKHFLANAKIEKAFFGWWFLKKNCGAWMRLPTRIFVNLLSFNCTLFFSLLALQLGLKNKHMNYIFFLGYLF